MKRSWLGVILLVLILLANLVFTQLTVNNFYFERYVNVIVFATLNLLLFPVAVWIYKKEAHKE
jgi:hypothetical protein